MKITFVDAVRIGLQKYFVFKGTATRPEFWYFILFTFLVGIVTSTVDSVLWPQPELPENATIEDLSTALSDSFTPLSTAGQIFFLIPSLSITARRLHDAGFSDKWLLLFLLPIAYAIFAAFGIAAIAFSSEGQQVDLMLALFLILPIFAISIAIGLAMLIMNLMPSRSFYNGNKYAEPTPLAEGDGSENSR